MFKELLYDVDDVASFPIFLIELHFGISIWRKIGVWTYPVILLEWLPIGLLVILIQDLLLFYEVNLGLPFLVLGIILIVAAVVLHSWTAKLIGIRATIGYTELKPQAQQTEGKGLITSGPFSVVRHPSYWAHTAIIVGFFLITGVISLGVIALIDLAITYFITTKLEDKELIQRFGNQYRDYQERVPKFFPRLKRSTKRSIMVKM